MFFDPKIIDIILEKNLWRSDDDGYRYTFFKDKISPPHVYKLLNKIPNLKIEKYFKKSRDRAVAMTDKKRLKIPITIGYKDNSSDVELIDLEGLPHILLAGTTNEGKTNILYNILFSSLLLNHPKLLNIIILDGSGCSFYKVKQSKIATVYDNPDNVVDFLSSIKEEYDRRIIKINSRGLETITDYNKHVAHDYIIPYWLVIFDEFQSYTISKDKTKRAVYHDTIELAAIVRKVGIHFVLTTQTPYREVVSGLLKANLPGRISLRCSTKPASQAILDNSDAFNLLKDKGQYLYQFGCYQTKGKSFFFSENEKKRICQNAAALGLNFSKKLDTNT